jgi:hypothetical protein
MDSFGDILTKYVYYISRVVNMRLNGTSFFRHTDIWKQNSWGQSFGNFPKTTCSLGNF